MADVGVIRESQIRQWSELLSSAPVIGNSVLNLSHYVRYIDEDLTSEQRRVDLGISLFITDAINGASVVTGKDKEDVHRILSEVKDRMYAHLLYNKEIHNLAYIDASVAKDPMPALINMAKSVLTTVDIEKDIPFAAIGIKGIRHIATKILN